MKFYRFIADIQLFGNFFMRKVLNTAHYKNFSGTFWQKIQSVIDYFLCFSRKNFIRFTSFQGGNTGIQFPLGMFVQLFRYFFNNCFVLKIIQTFMFDNRKHICRYIRLFIKFGSMFPIVNKGIYHNVFSYSSITGKGLGEPDETTFLFFKIFLINY